MSGEFHPRDGVLAGYYLVLVTFNWFFPAFVGYEPGIVICITVGALSAILVSVFQVNRPLGTRFNGFCFGAFLFLTLSIVATDLWIALDLM